MKTGKERSKDAPSVAASPAYSENAHRDNAANPAPFFLFPSWEYSQIQEDRYKPYTLLPDKTIIQYRLSFFVSFLCKSK
jgi:hypothetical protein